MVIELEGVNPLIHRSVIATICTDHPVQAFMVVGDTHFVSSKNEDRDKVAKQISRAGGIKKHERATPCLMIVFESATTTRSTVYEYMRDEGGIVINTKPVLDVEPQNSLYAGILNQMPKMDLLIN